MKTQRIILQGGRVVDPINKIDKITDLSICDEYIETISDAVDVSNAKVFDVKDKLVIPGIVDAHVHVVRPNCHSEGYRMLVKAGVTTAVEFKGPIDKVMEQINNSYGLNIAVLEGIYPGNGVSNQQANNQEVYDFINKSLDRGAIGIKLLGGHFPLTPETTKKIIEITNEQKGFVGFHVGTTATGSTIKGMEEAINLAEGLPLLIAHINAYCRGLITNPFDEIKMAMQLLQNAPNIISESHLAEINSCSGSIDNLGLPKSHITRNCLKLFNYPINKEGLAKAILDKIAAIYIPIGEEMQLLWGEEAYQKWQKDKERVYVSFPVNLRIPAIACAGQKDASNRFIVDAISTDGGAIPRNYILTYGLPLVKIGVLSLNQLIWKASYAPAQMFGLLNKGHLTPGSDADVTVVDPDTGEAVMTIINGKVCMYHGSLVNGAGTILTLERGANYLSKHKVLFKIIDLENSLFLKGKKEFYQIYDQVIANR